MEHEPKNIPAFPLSCPTKPVRAMTVTKLGNNNDDDDDDDAYRVLK